MDDYRELPFDQLRTLHRDVGALLAQKRHEALEQLREQAQLLGFSADELVPKRNKKQNGVRKYRDPNNSENTWGGKGPKPEWLTEAIDAGAQLEEFLVQ